MKMCFKNFGKNRGYSKCLGRKMATNGQIDQRFAERLFKHSETRVPNYSRLHPVVPRLYVQEWKTDMKNRKLILKNAELGGNPHYEHDENLFLDKREQMRYNVEDQNRVNSKCKMPARTELLRPPFHHEASRYQSELMMRQESELEGV